MKKVTLIVLASIFAFFVIAVVGIYFYASTQISPEQIRSIALEQLQKTFPKAEIHLGKVELSFGTSIELNLDQLDMKLSKGRKKYDLASVRNVSAQIPVWAILTGGGTIEVEVLKPTLGYYELGAENNWSLSMASGSAVKKKSSSSSSKTSKKESKKDQEISVPALASRFRLNVDVKQVEIGYGLKDGSSGKVILEKFLLKNLNFESATSFELLSKIDVAPSKEMKASLEMLVIGELNLAELIEKQTITCKTMVQVRNVKLSNFPGEVPDIKTDVVVKVDKKGNISGNSSTLFSSRNKITSEFRVTSKEIAVKNLQVELYMQDLLAIAEFKDKMINASKTKISVGGSVKMVGEKISPNIKFVMSPGIDVKYESVTASTTAKGSFVGKKLAMSSNTKVLEGNIDFSINHSNIDISDKNFDPFKLKPFLIDVRVANLKAPKKQLQDLIYAKVDTTKSKSSSGAGAGGTAVATAETNSFGELLLPASITKIKCERNNIGDSDFNCAGKIRTTSKSIITDYLKFNFSEGKGNITHSSAIKSKGIMSKFNFDLNGLDMISLSAFLPSMLDSITGVARGKVNGSVDYLASGALKYDVNVDANLKQGEIKGMDLAGKVNKIFKGLSKLPKVGDKFKNVDSLQIGDDFETLSLKGRFRDTRYDFSSFAFIAHNKKITMKKTKGGKGYLFPPPATKEGTIDIDLSVNSGKIANLLNKELGSKVVPVRVKGEGFSLMPDVPYILKKLGTKLAKTQAKTQAKKLIEKKAPKSVKKLLKKFKF